MSSSGPANLNSKHAWRELASRDLPKRSAAERVADFLEIHGLFDEETAREQASRCIQCPNPSCVSGCPLCNPIPQWMQLTAEGRFLEAAAVLGSVTNLAEVCTRLCPSDRLCEGTCILDSVGEPVAIQAIERFLSDYAFEHGLVDAATAPPNGCKVAVVGSGPGGMACADDLARKGCAVTIFDSDLVPGGLLVNGIPAFRLDRSIVHRRVELLQKLGVKFQLGVRLWDEVTLNSLRDEFNAVYLAQDWRTARLLDIPGADAPGVVPALTFLLQKNTAVPLDLPPLDVTGRRVLVIGGGNAAIDCLRTAIRCGAAQAIGLYRRSEAEMPCGRQEYQNAIEEGASFEFHVVPTGVRLEAGRVAGLRLIRTEPAVPGSPRLETPRTRPGSEFEVEGDWVIPALGFNPLPCLRTGGLELLQTNPWGGLQVDSFQETNLPGVFAGGDLTRGPSTVLEAVRDARRAAAQMLTWLSRSRTPESPKEKEF